MYNNSLSRLIKQQESLQLISQMALPYSALYQLSNNLESFNNIQRTMNQISTNNALNFYKNLWSITSFAKFYENNTFTYLNQVYQKMDTLSSYNQVLFPKIYEYQNILNFQQEIFTKFKQFENENVDEKNLDDILETVNIETLENQYNKIEQEKNSAYKIYLKENHLMILSLVLTIVIFIWTILLNKEDSEQNKRIISLLEQQNQISIETLAEEKEQTKLIKIQNELLKELITDINTKSKLSQIINKLS